MIKSVCSSHIVWETSIYGGVHSINKNLSGGSEWKNYLQHRKYEEDAILAPSVGVSLAANINSFTVSIGAEYSVYGEKTKYYPYSNQLTITDNSTWNTFIVNYIDTDTAYIFGNQRFIETIMQRTDSNYVFEQDTSEEYKYDQRIAQSNGVNRLYYVEIPLEVSYCLNKGRAGFGLSGGISPALLVQEKGYYIRSDGRGIDALSEMKTFRKFLINGRVSVDVYYRISGRTKLLLRPQFKTNLNSVFKDDFGIKQKYYSTGVLFGVTYMLN